MLDKLIKANITGSDFYIAAIGAALEIFGKYEEIQKTDGTPITVKTMLDEIRKVCSEYIVKTLTTNRVGNIDNLTKLYLTWRWAYGNQKVPYDDARKLCTGVGVNMSEHESSIIKRKGSIVTLLTHE